MAFSIWSTSSPKKFAVSSSETEPKPVIGHVVQKSDTEWVIEGQEEQCFTFKEKAAAALAENSN
jgi:hypothetical protein